MEQLADIGLVGLAVMGENLVLNMENKGFTVAVYNRTVDKVDRFIMGRGKNKKILPSHSLEDLISKTARPRKIMLMIKSGKPVDDMIDQLLPLLSPGDVVIDGGNSYFRDTIRRARLVESEGMLYIGTGISGGEIGALTGPSVMPGGSPAAWPLIKDIFQSIAAKVDNGIPCCEWMGENGAGHFVKMVHNGIEYGDMQLISEAYFIMKNLIGMNHDEMADIFSDWNKRTLNSYLIEITADILKYRDENGQPLLEEILDAAGQKGTGKWTSVEALELGVPLTLITEAVFMRILSAMKAERIGASTLLGIPVKMDITDKKGFVNDLEKALLASKIISYAQGYALMREAATMYQWDLDFGGIARIWRNGCIIRSVFLVKIQEAFDRNPQLTNLLLDPYFSKIVLDSEMGWRRIASAAIMHGLAVPSLISGLTFFDGYRTAKLPANLLQAHRDYFGAHMYERINSPRGQFFHTNWTGQGGDTTSSAYNG